MHSNEFVFSAPAVQRIGLANLDAMHSGAPAASPATAPTNVNIGVIPDRDTVPNWIRSQAGEAYVVDLVRRNWHRV